MENFWTIIAPLGGVQIVVTGLAGYIAKLWLQRTLQFEKAELEKILYTHNHRYKIEFETYQMVWRSFADYRFAIKQRIDRRFEQRDDPEKYERLCGEYQNALEILGCSIDRNIPFFTDEIRDEIESARSFAASALEKTKRMEPKIVAEAFGLQFEGYSWESAKKVAKTSRELKGDLATLEKKATNICNLIRKRVGFK